MTVLKIWKKHELKERKVIPTKAIVEKLRKSVKSLTKEEDDLLKERSVLYRQFGKDLEKGRGKTLIGVQCPVSDQTSSVCNRASFAVQPYAHILIDCETLLVFVTMGNQVTVKKNASRLLKHVMRLMEKKNRKIETVLDSQSNYSSAGVKAPRVSFSGNGQIGADLLKLLWTKDWMECIHTLYRSVYTQNVRGLWKYAKEHNSTHLKRYPLLGKSPLEAWRRLKR
jgi:hypothetical protein